MRDWQMVTIGSQVRIERGFAFRSSDYSNEGHFVLRVLEEDGRVNTNDVVFLDSRKVALYPSYQLSEGDILLVMVGATTGKLARVSADVLPALLNQNISNLKPATEELYKPFFYYSLHDIIDRFIGSSQGSARDFLKQSDFRNIGFVLPPLPQQRKIARILTTVDKLIEKTEALIAKYQAIKQGMMHDLFTRGVDEHGHLRPPYEQAPELYKPSELGRIPKEWEVRSVGEIAVVGGGVTLGRDLVGCQVIDLPYLRVANVQDGYLDLSEIKTVSVLKSEVDRFRLEHGDMLMTEGGDFDKLGRGTVWRGQISPCLHQNHIFRVRPSKEFILPDFLAAVTASSYGKRYFLVSSKQTTNLATINSTQLKAFPVPLPNLDEQGRMIAAIASAERQIEAEQRHSNQMKQTKTGLMQDLLTGKVRVKVDEAEEVGDDENI